MSDKRRPTRGQLRKAAAALGVPNAKRRPARLLRRLMDRARNGV